MAGEFSGKVAIVTGAASGISRTILTRFAREGAATVLADTDSEWGERIAQELQDEGNRVLFVRTDVRDSAQVDAMVARGVEAFGRVDILVHGAGVSVHK